eukprot:TRINITY_DN54700_c0_g1_i1.p1 TRINITY_DN54700_c0_g1~~TRINITY_DN54700_c0_g1_i1.p1  ORF type:complete len:699 (-),score=132.30 TRINITY_DN54700_c0_g1_i1:116-2212(-)
MSAMDVRRAERYRAGPAPKTPPGRGVGNAPAGSLWELGEMIERRVGDELAAIQMAVTAHRRQILLHVANLVRAIPELNMQAPESTAPVGAILDVPFNNSAPPVPPFDGEIWPHSNSDSDYMWQPLRTEASYNTLPGCPPQAQPPMSPKRQAQARMNNGMNMAARQQRMSPARNGRNVNGNGIVNGNGHSYEEKQPSRPRPITVNPPSDNAQELKTLVSRRDGDPGTPQAFEHQDATKSIMRKPKRLSIDGRPAVEIVEAPKEGPRRRSSQKKRESYQQRKPRAALFVDPSHHQADKIISQLERAYDVRDLYKETGCAQAMARSGCFETLTLICVTLNAAWMWVDADLNGADVLVDADLPFIIVENFFCFYFFGEWLTRAFAFRRICDGFRDTWFMFDGLLAGLMVFETWILTLIVMTSGSGAGGGGGSTSSLRILRLMRLSKLARMARLVQFIPELLIMIKGLAAGFRSVMTTLMLLMVTVYVFALGFRSLTAGSPVGADYFPTVYDSIMNLLVRGILPDHEDFVYALKDENPAYGIGALIFVFIATLTILNLLVGVLCEAVSVVATCEKEQLAAELVKHSLSHILAEVDESGVDDADKQISCVEFECLVQRKDFAQAVLDVGVDIHGLCGLSEEVFADGKTLSFEDFYKLLLQMRGSNYATVKHIIDIRMDILDTKRYVKQCFEEEFLRLRIRDDDD